MESTAQYWKPVWATLERYWKPFAQQRDGVARRAGTLHLAQAQSNRARRGRKRDFAHAERLVKRLVANELTLSFVPDPEQRLWRTLTRTKYQLTRNRVQLQNRLEALLEEAHLKLSSLVSDLLGASARRMLHAVADGATDPGALAILADVRLPATPEQLCDARGACQDLSPVYRRLIQMALEDLQLLERQIGQIDQELADVLVPYHDHVLRLAEVPGFGVDSAQQIIAEVGATAATFPSAGQLASWVGACPGDDESAGVNHSNRSPKGNRQMRRAFSTRPPTPLRDATAASSSYSTVGMSRALDTTKPSASSPIDFVGLIWKILHQGVRYEERGPATHARSKRARAGRMIRELRSLGYRVELAITQ